MEKYRGSAGTGDNFVYLIPSILCGIILPPEAEEAIRRGEIESVSVSKTCDKAIFKMRGKPTMFVPLREVEARAALKDGRGQSDEVLSKQKQAIKSRKRLALEANRKIFEDLEKQADEDLLKDMQNRENRDPKGRSKFINAKEAKRFKEDVSKFLDTFDSGSNLENCYGGGWKKLGLGRFRLLPVILQKDMFFQSKQAPFLETVQTPIAIDSLHTVFRFPTLPPSLSSRIQCVYVLLFLLPPSSRDVFVSLSLLLILLLEHTHNTCLIQLFGKATASLSSSPDSFPPPSAGASCPSFWGRRRG